MVTGPDGKLCNSGNNQCSPSTSDTGKYSTTVKVTGVSTTTEKSEEKPTSSSLCDLQKSLMTDCHLHCNSDVCSLDVDQYSMGICHNTDSGCNAICTKIMQELEGRHTRCNVFLVCVGQLLGRAK